MLILAGVSIATLTGENGILTRAQEAKNKTEEAVDIEKIRLAVSEAQIGENGYQELNQNNLQEDINDQFSGRDVVVSDNGDGSFTISLDKNLYKIENNQVSELQADLYIDNGEDLKNFRDEVNNGNTFDGKYIVLTNDILLGKDEEWIPIGVYDSSSTNPVDEINKPFKGIFDGNGHKIDNIYIDGNNRAVGLFGLIINSVIKNIGIGQNSTITGGTATGGVVGYSYNSKINNVYNESQVIINNIYGGGVVGFSKNTDINNSYNVGNITSNNSIIGGITSQNDGGTIKKCYNSGRILATGDQIGGITGVNSTDSKIEDCYNISEITGRYTIGGIIGRNYSECFNVYNVGLIYGSIEYSLGGIIGNNENGKVLNSYYLENIVTTGKENSVEGVCIKTSNELKGLSTILGNAFKADDNNINNGYPILKWQ